MGLALLLGMSALLGGLMAFVGFLFWKAMDYGKSWVVLLNHDTGKAKVKRMKIRGEGFEVKKDGLAVKGQYITEGQARYGSDRGNVHILEAKTGWNLHAPSIEALRGDPGIAELIVNNPYLYRNAIATNEVQDALDSNTGREHWALQLAPFALFAIFAILGCVAWLVYQFQKGGSPA